MSAAEGRRSPVDRPNGKEHRRRTSQAGPSFYGSVAPRWHLHRGESWGSVSCWPGALNRVTNVAGSNALGRALFPDLFPADAQPLNSARYLFLDPRSQTFYPDWETIAREAVSALRLMAGQDPSDRALMGPRRRTRHPQRRLPHLVGRAHRPHPHHRNQTDQPPHRRRDDTRLRNALPPLQQRDRHRHLPARTGLAISRLPRPAPQLDRPTRPIEQPSNHSTLNASEPSLTGTWAIVATCQDRAAGT